MLICVKVIPKAKKEKVLELPQGFKVYVNTAPEKGKANQRVIELVSAHLNIKKNRVKIIKGLKCREKVLEINGDYPE